MRQVSVRRAVAAASATAMAGAAVVIGGVGVASAAEASATHVVPQSAGASQFTITRTVSEGSPTYGEVVTMTTNVNRDNLGYLLYEVRDFTPSCMKLVPGSAVANLSGDISSDAERVRWANGAGRTATPFTMTAEYEVLCDAGLVGSGGTWMKRAPLGNSELGNRDMGPTITVKRLGTSVFLAQPAHPEVGKTVALNVSTTNIPDGDQVAFTVDGEPVGVAPVSNNQASLTYTPTSAGTKEVRANFVQTPTHGGSASIVRTMTVSQANVESSVSVTASDGAKVGQATQLTATVSPADAGGTVTFSDHGTEIGSAPVGADGTATIEWIPSVAGERTIDADFSGRTGVNPSNGAASVTVAAADPDEVATDTTLAKIPNAQVGEQITLTATVEGGATGGTVSFYDDGVLIGTANVNENGQASLNWTPTTEGDRTVRAVFSGHGVYLSSDAYRQVFIAPAIVEPEPEPEPDPDPTDPTDPDTGSLGSLTGSGGGGNASGSLGSLSSFGS